jgi:hypothetical protein
MKRKRQLGTVVIGSMKDAVALALTRVVLEIIKFQSKI